MSRKDDIMFALENLEKAKRNVHDNLPSSTINRINVAIEWIHRALDIAPTDAAIEEIINDPS